MSNDGKKCLIWLGGVLGVAVIVVSTAFALQMIFQRNTVSPAPVVQASSVAQVTDVKPHYISATMPQRECRKVPHVVYTQQEGTTGAGAVIGGVTGGLLGSQVGGGDGRIVTSAAGAAIGAITGNSVESSMNTSKAHTVYTTVCTTRQVKTKIQKGYDVTYSFNGHEGVIIMNDPVVIGSALPLPIDSTSVNTLNAKS